MRSQLKISYFMNTIERIEKLGIADPFLRDRCIDERVVRDGHVITAKGRAFVDFSFEIFDYLGIYQDKEQEKEQLFNDIMNR
ncbi:hypothetical protein [Paenibacillus sp. KS-LC4]|uniref:hypothetical protein n=1 Tax=Paenibacillus sp. KS-LC4 TaxID=2979727 RepID=UPI0030CC2C20